MESPSKTKTKKRKYAPKARGGCTTCKERHVRCDQARPRCGACHRSRRQCLYVGDEREDSTTSADLRMKVVMWEPDKTPLSLPTQVSTFPGQSLSELRAVEYFRAIVVVRLSLAFDSTFWDRLILQAAQSSSTLRRSIVALSTHWEKVIEPGSVERSTAAWECDTYSLQQYTMAISEMRQALQQQVKPRTEELLMSTLLFFCIEIFQNHYESALRQLATGAYMYCTWTSKRCEVSGDTDGNRCALDPHIDDSNELTTHIRHIFRRVMVQSIMFPVKSLHDPRMFVASFIPEVPAIPDNFHTLDEARDYFNMCITVIFHSAIVMNELTSRPAAPADAYLEASRKYDSGQAAFIKWQSAFKSFLQSTAPTLDFDKRGYCVVVEIQALCVPILVPPRPHCSELSYDDLSYSFCEILAKSTDLINSKVAAQTEKVFHYPKFDSGIVPPLFLVASRCRDPRIRREALVLLRRGPRQEGLWNGDMMAAVAERIMILEEEGGGSKERTGELPREACLSSRILLQSTDIPLSARLRLIDAFIYTNKRQVRVTLEKQDFSRPYEQRLRHEFVPY